MGNQTSATEAPAHHNVKKEMDLESQQLSLASFGAPSNAVYQRRVNDDIQKKKVTMPGATAEVPAAGTYNHETTMTEKSTVTGSNPTAKRTDKGLHPCQFDSM